MAKWSSKKAGRQSSHSQLRNTYSRRAIYSVLASRINFQSLFFISKVFISNFLTWEITIFEKARFLCVYFWIKKLFLLSENTVSRGLMAIGPQWGPAAKPLVSSGPQSLTIFFNRRPVIEPFFITWCSEIGMNYTWHDGANHHVFMSESKRFGGTDMDAPPFGSCRQWHVSARPRFRCLWPSHVVRERVSCSYHRLLLRLKLPYRFHK